MIKISLDKANNKKIYKINSIQIEDKDLVNQLKNLGFKPENEIKMIMSNYGKRSFLVSVLGISYALDKHICERIFVDEK